MPTISPPTPPTVPAVPAPIPQPLNLPKGSVRATLALLLSATLWYLVLQGKEIPQILLESVLLVVAFYFGTRSLAPPVSTLSSSPVAAAAAGAAPPVAREPLYLPRGAVRGILLVGFFGVVAYAWYRSGATTTIPAFLSPLILILQVLTSYLAGFIISTIALRRARRGEKPNRAVSWLRHGIAAASLAIVAAVCATILWGRPEWMPTIPDNFLAWAVAFYFGSRLSP